MITKKQKERKKADVLTFRGDSGCIWMNERLDSHDESSTETISTITELHQLNKARATACLGTTQLLR